MEKRRLRRVSALASFFSFIVVGFSGLVMLLWPGRGGHGPRGGGIETFVLGLDRHRWSETHEMAAIVFLIAALFHLALNWTPMKRHLGFGAPAAAGTERDFL